MRQASPWTAGTLASSHCVPHAPPVSSSEANASVSVPRSDTPIPRISEAMVRATARPAFMSPAPRPQTRPSSTAPEKGGRVHPCPAGNSSRWPARTTRGPPLPTRATRFGRPAMGSCHSGSMPRETR